MEHFVQNLIFKDRLGRKVLLFLIPILLFNIQNSFGQATPCASPIVYFLKTEGTSTDAALDGKIKLYGDVTGTNKVVVSTTALAAPTGNTEFTNAALFSSFTNGYIKTNAPNTNQTYYVRVYSADGLCYTDNTVNFEKTNFTAIPTQPDIMIAVSHNGGAFVAKNTPFTAVVTVQNDGTATATGLEVTVTIPAGLTVGTPTASVGTYNAGTGKWTIPSVAVGSVNNATLTFANTQSTTEGVKFISATLTAEAQTDKDSSPTTNNAGEDDQDVVCVSTPYELCNGNKIDITLASYTGIVWKKDGVTITGSVAGQYTLNANGSLTVFSIGEYSYNITSGPNACPTGGCCPIKVVAAPLPVLSLTSTPVSCFGGNNGTITATATSGTTPYEFSKDGTAFQSSGVFSTLTANTYTITAKDVQGCTATATIAVTQPTLLTASIAPTAPVICNGQSVSLNASAAGGTTPYTYAWSAGLGAGASKTVSPTATTLYTVTVTDGNGCTATATVNVTVNQTPIASAPAVAAICAGGTINLTSSNTNAAITTGLSYAWSGPNSFTSATQNPSIPNATVAAGGVYTVTITSATGGCTSTATVNVTVNQTPIASAPAVAAICAGGTINLTSSNTNAAITTGLSYSWSGPASFTSTSQNPSIPNATVAAGGVYTVTITSATGGCTSTATVNVTVNQTPIASAPAVAAICAGGTINLTSSNTNAAITTGLSYSWSGPASFTSTAQNPSIPNATVAAGGVYTVTITSATGGCTSTATVNVTVNQTPIASAPAVAAICAGGTINLTSSNTNAAITTGLSYSWSGPNSFTANTQNPSIPNATVAAGGVYTVTITSATGGCTSTATVNVTVNQTPIASAPAVAAICAGGTINLTSSNTNTAITTGLSYSWSGPASFTSTAQNPSIPNATVAAGGVYTVTITSATGGCTSTATVNVTVNQTPIASVPAVAAICAGGTINLTSSNTNAAITAGLSYAWSGPNSFTANTQNPSIPNATVAAGGVYTVTITSATGGCTSTATVNVTVNQTPIASAPVVAAICAGGTINLTSSNTNAAITTGLSYAWSGPNSFTSATQNPSITNATVAAGGVYTVTITSATGGCTSTATVNVTVNQTPIASTPAVAAICAGGTINLTSSNTNTAITSGLSYSWSGPASFTSTAQNPSIPNATVAAGGVYTVTITSATGGCTSTATVNVTVNQTPIASAPAVAAICAGGTINLTSSNTNAAITTGLSYAWSGPNSFTSTAQNPSIPNATVAAGGVYTVTITSATGGCTSTATVNVTVNQTPIASAPAVAAICAGGTINLTSSNTNTAITTGLSYAWSGPNSFTANTQNPSIPNATVAAGGVYTVTITSATGGCTSTATVNVTVNQTPIASAPAVAAICAGGTINLTSSNTNAAITTGLSYSWSGPNSFTANTQNPSIPNATVAAGGVYTVTITSGTGGCTSTATVNVTVNQTPIATATGDVECVGSTVNLTSSNTNTAITTGLSYSWSGPNSFTSNTQNPAITNVTAAAGGVYTVTITSGTGGCTSTATVNVTINPLPTATLTAPAACAGATTVLAPTGLSNAATFLWSTGATTSSISVNPTVPTGYTLTITSASSPACSITRTVWLDVKALPTAEVTAIPSSCIGSVSQSNGQLMLNKYRDSDQVAYGSPISATPTFANVPAGGIFASGLPNTATTYTIRLKNTITNCTNDLTATMAVTVCPCPAGYCEPATVVKTK